MPSTIYPVIGREKCLPFYLSGIGISDPEYHVVRESGLVSHQFMFTKCGCGRFLAEDAELLLEPGSLMYLPPQLPHEYFPEGGKWETHWLVFRGQYALPLMEQMGFTGAMAEKAADPEKLEHIFSVLLTAASDSVYGGEKCSELVYEYIIEARKQFFEEAAYLGAGSVIERSIEYIDANFSGDITLEQLADLAGISQQHYCRVFRKCVGMRPMEYISQKRIAKAKTLLTESVMAIGDIARAVGYSGLTYFGMVFRKYEGISPAAFRKRVYH